VRMFWPYLPYVPDPITMNIMFMYWMTVPLYYWMMFEMYKMMMETWRKMLETITAKT